MKHFPILGGKGHVVELPEGGHSPVISTRNRLAYYEGDISRYLPLPAGNWQIVGRLSEVMEAEAGELVSWDGPYNFFTVDTLVESLESAIEHEGYYFSNPHPMPKYMPQTRQALMAKIKEIELHNESQSRVLSRERTIILRRV